MDTIFFEPWVGKNYNNGYLNKKILILGESHYCEGYGKCNGCENFSKNKKCYNTIEGVESFLRYQDGIPNSHTHYMNTYTKFTNFFIFDWKDNDFDSKEVKKFFDSVIFYNYVQEAVSSPDEPPTKQMFQNSENGFFEVLRKYNPDIIIVWGGRLWNNLPKNGRWGDTILDKDGGKFYYYNNIPAYCIPHPASYKLNKENFKLGMFLSLKGIIASLDNIIGQKK